MTWEFFLDCFLDKCNFGYLAGIMHVGFENPNASYGDEPASHPKEKRIWERSVLKDNVAKLLKVNVYANRNLSMSLQQWRTLIMLWNHKGTKESCPNSVWCMVQMYHPSMKNMCGTMYYVICTCITWEAACLGTCYIVLLLTTVPGI